MSLYQCHTGINLTSDKLQLVEIEYKEDEVYLSNIDEEFFEEYLDFFEKETKFNSILQKAFDETLLRKKLKNNVISISLPIDIFRIVELPYDHSLIKADLIDQFKWELSVLFPGKASSEYLIQYVEIPDNKKTGSETVILIAAYKKQIQAIHKFCVRNNLLLKYVDYAPIAANSILQMEKEYSNQESFVSIYVGKNYYSFSFIQNSRPSFWDVKKISNISEIVNLVSGSFEKLNKKGIGSETIEKYFLSGDNIPDSLPQNIKNNYELEFVLLNPFQGLKVSDEITEHFINFDPNAFTASAGMALRLI